MGANSHPVLERHVAAALGLGAGEIAAALTMAGYVQKRHALDELAGIAAAAAHGG